MAENGPGSLHHSQWIGHEREICKSRGRSPTGQCRSAAL